MPEKVDPCGNEDCDACYPLPRWKVRTESVRRVVHERRIKAASAEAALAIYNEGTAWPSSYDDIDVEYLEEKPTQIEQLPATKRAYYLQYVCWNRPDMAAETSAFLVVSQTNLTTIRADMFTTLAIP